MLRHRILQVSTFFLFTLFSGMLIGSSPQTELITEDIKSFSNTPHAETVDRGIVEMLQLIDSQRIYRRVTPDLPGENSHRPAQQLRSEYEQPHPPSLVDDESKLPQRVRDQLQQARGLASEARAVFTVTDPSWALDTNETDGIYDPPTFPSAIQNANYAGASTIVVDPSITTLFVGSPVISASVPITLDGDRGDGTRLIIDGNGTGDIGIPFFGGNSVIKNVEVRNCDFSGISLKGAGNVVQNCDVHNIDGPAINFNDVTSTTIGGSADGEPNILHDNFGTGSWGVSIIEQSHNNLIIGNYIGSTDGMTGSGSTRAGVLIGEGSNGNVITDNLIVDHEYEGIQKPCCDTSWYNVIDNNYIGYAPMIDDTIPNLEAGINIQRSVGDTIRNNVISGNDSYGIRIFTRDSDITDNIIGTNPSFSKRLGNQSAAISGGGGSNVLIEDNVVSANRGGMSISEGCTISGNRVGGWDQATSHLGNQFYGIQINGPNCVIGGANSYNRNFVSANLGDGIRVAGFDSDDAVVENNFVGLDLTGTTLLGNLGHGIVIKHAVQNAIVRNNVIAGAGKNGIHFDANSTFTADYVEVYDNLIGTDVNAVEDFGCEWNGIFLNYANYTTVGQPDNDANVIVNSDSAGIKIMNGIHNEVFSNYIGTNKNFDYAFGNASFGVVIENADSNYVGGLTDALANLIGGNDSAGVAIVDGAQFNQVKHNVISIDIDSVNFIPNDGGILIRNATNNLIGGPGYDWGNEIIENDGIGIEILANDNTVQANWVNFHKDVAKAATEGHGIHIDGSGNKIGGDSLPAGNLITGNEGAGVYVLDGIENEIRFNRIFENDGPGIDLDPAGVTLNDSLDSDGSPNNLQNFPVIDSGFVDNGQTIVYGHIHSEDATSYVIDFFRNDSCDASDYGEGRYYQDSVVTMTVDHVGPFVDTLGFVVDSLVKITVTATDEDGNTSEFSSCWPFKIIEVVDRDSGEISNREFTLFRVRNDIPKLTHDTLGYYRTDDSGWIFVSKELFDEGDTAKVEKMLFERETPKRSSILPIAYRIYIDNGKFDDMSFNLNFTEIGEAFRHIAVMNHTTVAYNLLVSIEWDASPAYVQNLQTGMQNLSNYMYDVYDGQIRFDSIYVTDQKLAWGVADVRLNANNVQWPNSTGARLLEAAKGLEMPRRWFGNTDDCRNTTVTETPLNVAAPDHFRTLGHELGHYMMAFKDEYKFDPDDPIRCPEFDRYGYMDSQYPGGEPVASELSWSRQYADSDCRNTYQWLVNDMSCADWYEQLHQRVYDGIPTQVFDPS